MKVDPSNTMPRIGMNPSRNQNSGYAPTEVTVAVLTHVPNNDGYFEHRFDVLKACIESLIANTSPVSDILVFDNASSKEVVDYLRELYEANRIQYLILSSRNVGKIDALQMISRATPGQIIAYTDDDILFLPDWLDSHLKILSTFPKVGMVTGFYIRSQLNWSVKSTLALEGQAGIQTEHGVLWDRHWEDHYCENMGRAKDVYAQETAGLHDTRFTLDGIQALASAGHHQFVTYKDALIEALPDGWSGKLMGKMRELDEAYDQLGYIRLNTHQPVTRLLGNVISLENAETAKLFGIDIHQVRVEQTTGGIRQIAKLPIVNGILRKLYRWLFRMINS